MRVTYSNFINRQLFIFSGEDKEKADLDSFWDTLFYPNSPNN